MERRTSLNSALRLRLQQENANIELDLQTLDEQALILTARLREASAWNNIELPASRAAHDAVQATRPEAEREEPPAGLVRRNTEEIKTALDAILSEHERLEKSQKMYRKRLNPPLDPEIERMNKIIKNLLSSAPHFEQDMEPDEFWMDFSAFLAINPMSFLYQCDLLSKLVTRRVNGTDWYINEVSRIVALPATNLAGVKRLFLNRFCPAGHEALRRQKLFDIRYRRGETPREFFARAEKLFKINDVPWSTTSTAHSYLTIALYWKLPQSVQLKIGSDLPSSFNTPMALAQVICARFPGVPTDIITPHHTCEDCESPLT